MKINATIHQEVFIDPAEALETIREELGLADRHECFIGIRDGNLVRGENINYHGSPMYEYSLISNNPKWIELYKSVECLQDYFEHSNEPEWDRKIQTEEQAEENCPVMKM